MKGSGVRLHDAERFTTGRADQRYRVVFYEFANCKTKGQIWYLQFCFISLTTRYIGKKGLQINTHNGLLN